MNEYPRTESEVIDIIIPIINIASVKNTIGSGKIYRKKRPINSKTSDITVNTLGVLNSDQMFINNGTGIINAYRKNLTENMADETHLTATAKKIIEVLKNYSSGSTYFYIVMESINIMQDMDDNSMSYVSVRFTFYIEKR